MEFEMMTPGLEHAACPICENGTATFVLEGTDRLHSLPGSFRVVKCHHCGLMRTDPRPTPAHIGAYYPDDYGPYLTASVPRDSGKSAVSRLRGAVAPLVRGVFDTKDTAIPPVRPGRMLEIGCATGTFLTRMASAGWKVSGIEFSERAASVARSAGHDVEVGALEGVSRPEQTYDLVTGWMVLEHLHQPVACLQKLASWTKDEGWLALSVPNAGSLEFRVFKDRWYALQLPSHLYHFTPESLTRLLAAGGWRVERILHQRSLTNATASARYLFQDLGWENAEKLATASINAGPLLTHALFPLAWSLSHFGQTGRMTVWARKDSTNRRPVG